MSKSNNQFLDHQMQEASEAHTKQQQEHYNNLQYMDDSIAIAEIKKQSKAVILDFLKTVRLTTIEMREYPQYPYYSACLPNATNKLKDLHGNEGTVIYTGVVQSSRTFH